MGALDKKTREPEQRERRTVDDLWFARIEHLADLTRHERLAGAGRTIEEDALDVPYAELLDERLRIDARGKGATEDRVELVIEAADPQILKFERRLDDALARLGASTELDRRIRHPDKEHLRVLVQQSTQPDRRRRWFDCAV